MVNTNVPDSGVTAPDGTFDDTGRVEFSSDTDRQVITIPVGK